MRWLCKILGHWDKRIYIYDDCSPTSGPRTIIRMIRKCRIGGEELVTDFPRPPMPDSGG